MAKELEKIGATSKLPFRQKRQGNILKDKLNIWPRFVHVNEELWNCAKYG